MASCSAEEQTVSTDDDVKCIVLVAVDASKQSQETVDYYFDKLYKADVHRVILLHVIELPAINHAKEGLTVSSLHEIWTKETSKSNDLKEHYIEMIKQKGVTDVSFRQEYGVKPGLVIISVATEIHASMIVTGTRGKGLIRRTILGSVSDYVVHHASCPVVVCRSDLNHDRHHLIPRPDNSSLSLPRYHSPMVIME